MRYNEIIQENEGFSLFPGLDPETAIHMLADL